MATRKSQQTTIPPSLTPERAYAAIKKQLESLQTLRGKNYMEAEQQERQWTMLTQSIIERSFGNTSSNLSHFYSSKSAGNYFITPFGGGTNHGLNQSNFEERINSLEAFLKSTLSELELIMPEKEIQGQYDIGDQYEFYRDIRAILGSATTDVMIVDPYLSTELFDVYADGINKSIHLRILTNNPPSSVSVVATKYAAGGKFELRTSAAIHDRLILIDQRAWFIGQSIKDAAKKKPTYVVEQDGTLVRPIYESIWNTAAVVI